MNFLQQILLLRPSSLAPLTHPSAHALLADDRGQDLIEYALLAGLIGLGALTAIKGLGTKVSAAFTTVNSDMTNAL